MWPKGGLPSWLDVHLSCKHLKLFPIKILPQLQFFRSTFIKSRPCWVLTIQFIFHSYLRREVPHNSNWGRFRLIKYYTYICIYVKSMIIFFPTKIHFSLTTVFLSLFFYRLFVNDDGWIRKIVLRAVLSHHNYCPLICAVPGPRQTSVRILVSVFITSGLASKHPAPLVMSR